jgi:subtilisin-like proprotein convertase family protein
MEVAGLSNERSGGPTKSSALQIKEAAFMRRPLLLSSMMVLALLLASAVALAATTTFENSSPIHMDWGDPDSSEPAAASPYPSEIDVSGLSTCIQDVNLTLKGINHTFADDVDVLVVGPQGQSALVMSDVGGRTGFSGDIALDDEATGYLPDSDPITAGTYKPTQGTASLVAGEGYPAPADFLSPAPAGPYDTQLSVFDGTDPNGTWYLYVLDDTPEDGGNINGWSLEITTAETPCDTTAPKVISTSPKADATEVAPTANVRATFSEGMDSKTIDGTTFQLFKKGTTTQIPAQVSYNADTNTAKLDPTNNLRRGVAYKAVVTTWAKDVAGNRLDQDGSTSGLQQMRWFFRVDD